MSAPNTATILAQAFEHRGRIRQLARECLSSDARRVYDSEDLVATVYRRILEAEPTTASEAQTWEFIRTVATRAAIGQTRKAAVRSRAHGTDAAPTRNSDNGGNAKNAENAHDAPELTLQEVLDALPDHEMQQVIALRYRGARFRVIATAMGISERTAFRRWGEAQKLLAEKGYDLVH